MALNQTYLKELLWLVIQSNDAKVVWEVASKNKKVLNHLF